MNDGRPTAILVRTDYCDDRLTAFAARLEREGGHDVYLLADETHGVVDAGSLRKLVLTRDRAKALGLVCPANFGWRCGDYGFYLARQRLPHYRHFWMIEPDTRPSFDHYGALFGPLSRDPADFIAPHLMRAGPEQWWYPTMRWRTPDVWRCFFGFVRLSVPAIDLCWAERRRHARRFEARMMWPNDETFVATTVVNGGLRATDLNAVREGLCTIESFGYHDAWDGDALDRQPSDGMIYHPVLQGERLTRKRTKVVDPGPRSDRYRLKLQRGLAKLMDGRLPGLVRTGRTL